MSSISAISPTLTISNQSHYVFRVVGVFNGLAICVFSQQLQTLYSSEISNFTCDLRA